MNNSFSDRMTKLGAIEDLSNKGYPQVKQEEVDIQVDPTLQSKISFERLSDRTNNNVSIN